MAPELEAIISPWLAGGLLAENDAELVKADYAKDFGLPGACTPCYWNNVKTHYRLLLRKKTMTTANPKYIVNPDILPGSFRPFGEQKAIVTLGTENENSTGLTDEIAEHYLKVEPSFSEIIIENKAYKPLTDAQKRVAAVQSPAPVVTEVGTAADAVLPVDSQPATEPQTIETDEGAFETTEPNVGVGETTNADPATGETPAADAPKKSEAVNGAAAESK